MSMYKAGRAVGKGVKYLTSLGSKIGKSLGSSVDKLGAGTRNAQASVIKGARGARDAASTAGAAARRGVKDARAGYDAGRRGNLHLDDVMPKKSSGTSKLPSLNEWMNTKGKGYIKNPGTMPGHGDMNRLGAATGSARDKIYSDAAKYFKGNRGAGSPGTNGKNWAIPVNKPKSIMPTAEDKAALKLRLEKSTNYMTKRKPAAGGGGIINKPPGGKRPAGAGDYMSNSGGNNYKIGRRISDDEFVKSYQKPGMSKNRRAGIITGASIAAGYGVHKGNDALQNHYRQQKNAARGG